MQLHRLLDADAVIAHGQHGAPLLAAQAELDHFARAVGERIAYQVLDHLLAVGRYAMRSSFALAVALTACADGPAQ